jgi:hypothetical protein
MKDLKNLIKNIILECLNENITSCDFFNLKTTGMSYYDEIVNNGSQHKHPSPNTNIVIDQHNPIKFILKHLNKNDYGRIIQKTMTDPNYIQNEKISKIILNMQNGVKYDTPIIDLIDKYNFQEGRHRVIAASKLGCELIPVYVFGTDTQLKNLNNYYK